MINTRRSIGRIRLASASGFSLIEIMIAIGIMLVVMAATMTALSQAMKANQAALLVTGMNANLRTAMDLMIRDLLQVGSGLPTGHYVLIPAGAGSQPINLPGPPTTAYQSAGGDVDLNAVNPGTRLGPLVNLVGTTACTVESSTCIRTDMVTTLSADSTFNDSKLVARSADGTTIDVDPAVNIGTGPDRVLPGQLIMLQKGSYAVLLQVTAVNAATRRITFASGDSLKLNQHGAPSGSTTGLKAFAPSPDLALPSPQTVPPTPFLNTTATRIRMISYYIDATTDPAHPRLVRRVNNGSEVNFNNNRGNVVAFDVENLQISYDIADGVGNPAAVVFDAADLAGTGKCAPQVCSFNQIRKVNIALTARSRTLFAATKRFYRNTLRTQVSLRGMSFVNEYTSP